MVSDGDSSDATASASDAARVDAGDPTYDVVYRATRDAMWDVVGTATLILFYLALAGIGLSVAWTGLGFGLDAFAIGVGLVGLAVCLFAASRVYALATE